MRLRTFRIIFVILLASAWLVGVTLWLSSIRQIVQIVTAPSAMPTPRVTESDIWNAAVVATYEAQVFPEPIRTDAYAAIIWTIRNRVEIGFKNSVGYSDDQVLKAYSSYPFHRDDPPDARAIEVARQILFEPSNENDPTHGARNYVDHSFWTGTNEQIGSTWKYRGRYSDVDVQRLVDDGKFKLAIEWKSGGERPGAPIFYGLYFFDYWPPVMPIVTPLPTFTRTATPTRTRTPTLTLTPRFTATLTLTPRFTPTATITIIPTATIPLTLPLVPPIPLRPYPRP